MVKAAPDTGAKLINIVALNTIEVVHHQYFATSLLKVNNFSETKIPDKKIHDLFEGCELKTFWERLERREQRAFCSTLKIV
jgi:hypothetical protein